ncbi:alpha/beta-hydrolase [Xylariaceae sp. FL0804]|nr:alpha/beta-hydrolase [Xylariaceae sp. FL0804]
MHLWAIITLLILPWLPFAFATASPVLVQHPLRPQGSDGISVGLFAALERLSRLVDITYCVGTTGISRPFSCISRCKDFPALELITTWNTGALMTDSCGYIAVDHGLPPLAAPATGADGSIIVAFRGTYSITNTVVDLSTVPQKYVPYPPPEGEDDKPPEEPLHRCLNCTVHMGFLGSWGIARKEVLPKLKSLRQQYPDYPIHLVGHSLGGAVAALASLELKAILGWDNVAVTTFGEPRVGNQGFVDYLDSVFELGDGGEQAEERTYRRVTHVDDPVPLLPLSEWGYRSHAGEFFISKSDLSPEPSDIRPCTGDYDMECIAGSDGEGSRLLGRATTEAHAAEGKHVSRRGLWELPARFKLWQLFFAHRDYFWRLGLCVPGGDPADWGRDPYPNIALDDELR